MATVNLQAAAREGTGKGHARKLRQAERIPVILYGHGTDPVSLSLSSLDVRRVLNTAAGSNAVLKLDVEGDSTERAAIIKDIQRHPVTRDIIHLDLLSVDLTQPVEVTVPVRPTGVPVGVKMEGGVLGWARRELLVRVLPTNIPESIELDISGLHLNDAVHIGDIEVGEGVELLEDEHLTICSVASQKLELEEPTDEEAEGEEGEGEEGETAEGESAEGEESSSEDDES